MKVAPAPAVRPSGAHQSYDVIIAGAGPAGIAAAVALAARRPDLVERGRLVVLDRARFPRAKPCGGGLTGHAHSAMAALGLSLRVPFAACDTGRVVYGREVRTVTLARPVDVVRREDFDADLVAQARERGIVILEGEGVASFQVEHQGHGHQRCVQVTTSTGRHLTSKILVGAEGAASLVREAVRGSRRGNQRQPLRLFRLELEGWTGSPTEMIYDFSAMDEGLRGYVWLFPVPGGRVNVGVLHYPSRFLSGGALERLLERVLSRYGVRLPGAARGWPAWPYEPHAALSAPHLLCTGDAAGIDALTGEGIAVGLEEGPLVAEAIDEALSSDRFTFEEHARRVRHALVGRELTLDDRLARLLYAPSGHSLWLSLVLFDPGMLSLYAARVSGSQVLADETWPLLGALFRHLMNAPRRLAQLKRARQALPGVGAPA